MEDSRDLTQDAFVRVYEGVGRFRWNSRFKTWLFRIAGNIYLNYRRDRKTQKRDDQGKLLYLTDLEESGRTLPDGDASGQPSRSGKPLEDALEKERVEVLREAIEKLPPQMRRCVYLWLRDRKMREIAELMKVSINTAKAHLFQARKRLAPLLGEYFDPLNPEDEKAPEVSGDEEK